MSRWRIHDNVILAHGKHNKFCAYRRHKSGRCRRTSYYSRETVAHLWQSRQFRRPVKIQLPENTVYNLLRLYVDQRVWHIIRYYIHFITYIRYQVLRRPDYNSNNIIKDLSVFIYYVLKIISLVACSSGQYIIDMVELYKHFPLAPHLQYPARWSSAPREFFFVKSLVYTDRPRILVQLKENIQTVIDRIYDIYNVMLQKAKRSFKGRLYLKFSMRLQEPRPS